MGVAFTNLEIAGDGGQSVPNLFLRQDAEASTLAVMLPGQGYTARMPLFYYAERIGIERGWDVLSVDYSYLPLEYDDDPAVRMERLEARKRELEADVEAALDVGLNQRPYERIVLIGKSLGTRAMAHLLGRGIELELWNIWLTPLINAPEVREAIEAHPVQTFVAIGTEDFAYDAGYLEHLDEDHRFRVVVIEGADHSMDIPGDLAGSIRVVGDVMGAMDGFLPAR